MNRDRRAWNGMLLPMTETGILAERTARATLMTLQIFEIDTAHKDTAPWDVMLDIPSTGHNLAHKRLVEERRLTLDPADAAVRLPGGKSVVNRFTPKT